MSIGKKSALLVILILIADQALKIWVKTSMYLGETIPVFGDWFNIHFIENNGMAFGLEFAGSWGKILLTIFRIIAISLIIWYLNGLIKKKANQGLILTISLILAGAIGNIIDSMFYGMIFDQSFLMNPSVPGSGIASLFPESGGYAPFLQGKVVDMLYFPVINAHYPQWFPFVGGDHFIFFRPVFNIADASISTGVIAIIVFQRKLFHSGIKE